jgi:hypothetical protein
MKTLAELHSLVEERLNINDFNDIVSRDYLTDVINGQRALFIRNEYNKRNRSIDPDVIQDLGCVDLELVDAVTCCDLSIPVDCQVLRTKTDIPKTIEFHNSKGITRVGGVEMLTKAFNYVDMTRLPYVGNGRANRNEVFYFLYKDRIYLYSKAPRFVLLKHLNVMGIFEDPTAAGTFKTCSGETCWSPDKEYPIKDWMWEYIEEAVVQRLLQKQSVPTDESANNKEDAIIAQPSK